MISENEFLILLSLINQPTFNQRQLAEITGLSVGTVNSTYRTLEEKGLTSDYSVTDDGIKELEPFKVKNAVILAAGLSSRLAPITYDRPKGMLKVRGEILIERQIEQLLDAGIDDIYIVVGFKKEEFFYLEEKYGVKLVVSPEYMERNNHSSIWEARHVLGNTYVCSSDNYFTINPFNSYEFASFTAATECHSAPQEYFLKTKGSVNRIVGAELNGHDGFVMMGHTFWNEEFSKKFIEILQSEWMKPETEDKLWDEIFYEHVDELVMRMKEYPRGVIQEFDSLDQVSAFDPEFIQNVGSDVLDNICNTLSCERSDIRNIDPIKQGLTNLSFYFECRGDGYVYRHPGAGTNEIINRPAETFACKTAADLGLDETFVTEDATSGWKISKFVPDCTGFDYSDTSQVERALGMVRKLHQSGIMSPWSFDFYDESLNIVHILKESGWTFPSGFDELQARIASLVAPMRAGAGAPVLCHNDFYGPNLLVHGKDMWLIDWEYSAMGDYGNDFGNFIAQSDYYDVEGAIQAMSLYFGKNPTPDQEFHLIACSAVVGWYWYVWAMFKELKGAPAGEWLYVWYRAAKEFSARAIEMLGGNTFERNLSMDEFRTLAKADARRAGRDYVYGEVSNTAEASENLEKQGFLRDGEITALGVAALEPYRVKRGVLLAAGFGSRLLPVTVNTPKPLARVNGLRIIDRLIDGLLAAGVTEIYVVRGYLAEEFDQLLNKYPDIKFIENPLYSKTNNISSALAAIDHFEDAYVFESDLLLENQCLLTPYQYRSNYLGIDVDSTDDWRFLTDENERICDLDKGDENRCWQMVGVSYWEKSDAHRLAEDIREVFETEEGKQIFWDEVPILHKNDHFDLYVRPCKSEDIVEIDDFEDLQRIDPSYIVKKKAV